MKKYTLITGSSQGMGKQMAVECAMRGRNVLLVSLPNENLKNIADHIAKEYNIETDYFECDLTVKESAENIFNWTKDNNYFLIQVLKEFIYFYVYSFGSNSSLKTRKHL